MNIFAKLQKKKFFKTSNYQVVCHWYQTKISEMHQMYYNELSLKKLSNCYTYHIWNRLHALFSLAIITLILLKMFDAKLHITSPISNMRKNHFADTVE